MSSTAQTSLEGSGRAIAVAARDYWSEKVRRATPIRLGKASDVSCDREFRVSPEPALAERVRQATGDEPDALLIIGLAALAVLAERYTCVETPLLASQFLFAPSVTPDVTPRILIENLSTELEECEVHDSWSAWQENENPTGWGLTVRDRNAPGGPMRGLEFWLEWAGSSLIVRHASGSVPAPAAERLARQYLTALRTILTHPDTPLAGVELLDESDQLRLTEEYSRNSTDYPRASVAALFEQQALASPNAVAVIDCTDGERHWTYAELNRQANRLAQHLIALGVGPEELVPILADRGAALVRAVLAVLKAGGAYVPVDPDSPPERIRTLLRDSAARFALVSSAYMQDCDGLSPIDLDSFWQSNAGPDGNPEARGSGETLAYVMYTSGSTGRPKGVMIEQRSIVRLVRNTNFIELGVNTRVLQTGSMAFDAATLEVWGPLLNGGTLVLATTEELLDSALLKELLHRHKITTIWLTATWMHQLVDMDLEVFAGLNHLLAGGERLSVRHVNALRSAYPRLRITNGYGPTENTTFTACHAIDREYEDDIPIGRPIANTSVIVLDARGRLAPEYAAGELCTGGAGLARGYWNAPELTAAAFLSNPLVAGGRLYRTGDRACWREGGVLSFLGRIDSQIKLRGYRIEPGEIETVLAQHPAVAEAVVCVRDDKLAAWIVPAPGAVRNGIVTSIRDFVASRLPSWMAPAHYLVIEKLPLNRNGKADRAALILPPEESEDSAPRSDLEISIAAAFGDVLGRKPIGAHANFFELGGHSLRAMELIARLRRQVNLSISIRDLFLCPTVEQLARLAEERGHSDDERIPVIPDAPAYAVSPAQRRLWILDQLDPGNAAYNMPAAFGLEGPLDLEAIKKAVQTLIERHEVLRTRFEARDGEPVQIVEPAASGLQFEDLSAQSAPSEKLREELTREAAHSFALDRLPLFRIRLLRLTPDYHALLINLHHIIGDGWSSGILLREISVLYDAFTKGTSSPLGPLRIQYRDAAAWQNSQLASGALAEDLAYWKKHLAAPLPALDLPADYSRPPAQVFEGCTVPFRFGQARTQSFERLRQRMGPQNTPFATLLACVYALLNRLSGQDDLIVGIPIAGRYHPDLQEQVGFYVNTLALRQKLAGEQRFGALLERVREMLAEAYDHQALPFERLVEELELRRDISRGGVFDVFASYQDQENYALQLCGLDSQAIALEETRSKFDLSFYFSQAPDGLVCAIEFNTRLFETETIERFASHLFALIDDLVSRESPAAAEIADLELLDAGMRKRILSDFNPTARDYPPCDTMVSLLEAQAGRTPDRTALTFEERSLTYRQLNARANFIAGYLRQEAGIRPGDLVGVFRERTPDTVAALLAVLKAGAAYVPVDPAYPPARVSCLLEDSRARLVLADGGCVEAARALGFRAVDLDKLPGESAANPRLAAGPRDLAYIIYTSGSTGNPKGVAIEHHSVATFIHWCEEEFTEDFEVVFAGTSLCFDLSIFELFYSLATGKRIRLLRSGMEIDRWLPVEDRNLVNTVPSVVKDLVARNADFSRTLVLNIPGEPIPLSLIEALQQQYPECAIRNLYGPSEDTTYSTCYLFPRKATRVLVGRAVSNTDAYILDSRLRPVPIGVSGEIYLSGDKLAREYLHRPDLTAEKFIQNPFRTGWRMYRVQDLARWTPDGNIDVLGRTDDQVKVRGFRIELGEIEHVLRKHPSVTDVAVVPHTDNLVAFVVATGGVAPDILREFLGQTLPAYMIPSRFSIEASLPLTPNGKIDRKALRAHAAGRLEGAREVTAPRDEIERTLVALWESILERGPIGVTDNFFDLGGHSLKATRLLARAAAQLGAAMPLKTFFAAQTIAAQAAWFRNQKQVVLEPIPQTAPAAHYALSAAQMRLLVLCQINPESRAYYMPGVFRVTGPLDVQRLTRAFSQVVLRHESLRTRFVMLDGEPRQIVDSEARTTLAFQSVVPEALETAVRDILVRPFDLASDHPLRAVLFQTAPEEFTLAFVMHHLAGDAWSLSLMVRELLAEYSGAAAPPPLPIQYKDYAAWLNSRIGRGDLDEDRAWWHAELSGPLPVLDLPSDFPRPAVQRHDGAEVAFEIDADLASRWNAVARTSKATLFSSLLAAFQALLFRYTGQEDIVIGTAASGRIHPDLEPQIGLYVNTLALRGSPRGSSTFVDLLDAAQKKTIEVTSRQAYPFDRLVEELPLPRDLSRSAIFDVMLVVEQERVAPSIPGLEIREAALEGTQSKFDLTLYAVETPTGISCRFAYNSTLFRRDRIERMARHFRNLLTSAAARPGETLAHLDLCDPEEREGLLHGWNRTEQPHPIETAIARFERIAAVQPKHVAVVCEHAKLTYGELNCRANALAKWLVATRGVTAGDRVGVMLTANERLPEALLAIWKVGATYVPVDPANPAARIELILADSGVRTVLTQDLLASADVTPVSQNPEPAACPDDAAYMIYTSGTTGVPKGAVQPHHALVNYVSWLNRAWRIGSEDRSGLVSSYAFDLGYTTLWGTLLNGGELVFPSPGIARDPERMVGWIVDSRLTYLKATPSLFEMLLGSQQAARFADSSLRLILLGGELLRIADVRRFLEIRPSTRFVNHYGPTETTIGSIAGELETDRLDLFEMEPALGRPIDNTRIYVVDSAGELAPIGIPGEIWISGAGVGLGYWNDREPERFLDDPWHPGGRVYRTGDRGRWTQDGRIQFLGRADQQVKVRGYRVELREIENTLREFSGVTAAAAIAETGESGVEILACVAATEPVGLEELRVFLSARLPDYMMPSSFAVMEQLPLTPNGKLDADALRRTGGLRTAGREIIPPRNEIETCIASLWCEVLRRDQAGVRDDFFLAGGHSLRAASLLSRVYRETGVAISLAEFFNTPTIEWIASRIGGAAETASSGKSVVRIPDAPSYEISPAQERLWLLHHIDPQGLAYSMPSGFVIEGPLEAARLRRAADILVARHETLRTVFVAEDGRPRQRVLDTAGSILHEVDVREAPDPMAAALAWQREDAARAFDLERGPLARLHILRTGERQWVLLLNMHHIVSDGWSMGVLAHELIDAYRGESLPPLEFRYRDVAAWQRQRLDEAASRQYWHNLFAEPAEPLALPADRARPAIQSFAGDRVTYRFPAAWRRSVEALAHDHRATLFMVLAAGVQALLARYSGQQDICVGTAAAGRATPEFEKLIGLFVQTIVLRSRVEPECSFGKFLDDVRRTALDAFDHGGYAFDRLVEELKLPKDLSRNPLFDVMVVLQNTEPMVREFAGIRAIPLEPARGAAKFDLNFVFTAEGDGLRLDLEYATALFDRGRIERLCRHFEVLLSDAAAEALRPIADLKLLTLEEDRLLRQVAAGEERALPATTVLDAFEEQVACAGEAIALEFPGGRLTYAELNRRANSLARYIRQRCPVEPDDLVALLLPRSEWLAAAILGVWKAGAAWLPLDVTHPKKRLEALAAHARLTLTDRDIAAIASEPFEDLPNPARRSRPEALAYVLFTSGSTGEPKGCMVEHRNIWNYIDWAARMYPSGQTQYSLHSPITFDLTLTSLFCPLVRGESLRIYPAGEAVDRMLLDTFDAATPVNFVKLTPSHILLLTDLPLSRTNVAVAVAGGEAVTAAHVQTLRRLNPAMRFINEYGPTETAVGSMWYEAGNEREGPISIGRPIQNTDILILDAHLRTVPEGVAGEICIGGAGVGRGYLGRPDLTNERFVPHPWRPSERVYRTGDFGKWSATGFEYLGRRDGQVKIRGHRIELAEIEACLSRCSGVRQAVVDVRGATLHAWVQPEDSVALDEATMLDELARTLPEYMLPARIVAVAEMPFTANGKLDRTALPDPGSLETKTYEPPATKQEQALADVWRVLLGKDQIGRNDHFFHLGGDSIRAVQMSYRLRELGWSLEVPALFAAPTLAAAALQLAPATRREARRASGSVLPLTPIQEWFFAMQKTSVNHFDQSVMLASTPDLDPAALEQALNVLIAHHESLRLRFRRTESGIVQTVDPDPQRVKLQILGDSTPDRIAQLHAGLDIEAGPLVAAALLRSGDAAKVLLIIHHLAVDGYSWRILLEDLEAVYRQASPPASTDSFGAWAEAVQALRQSGLPQSEAAWWSELAAGHDDPLPGDVVRDCIAARSSRIEVRLTSAETADLTGAAGRAYNTNPMELLLAALAIAAREWYDARWLRVFVESHGREAIEQFDLSRTVGWFTCRYPVAIHAAETDPSRLLKSVKEAVRATPRQGVGYGILQTDPAPARISFNYLGQFDDLGPGLFRILPEDSGPNLGPGCVLPQELGIVAAVARGELVVEFTFPQGRWTGTEIRTLADRLIAATRSLITHCLGVRGTEATPSDFTYKGLSLGDLEGILDVE